MTPGEANDFFLEWGLHISDGVDPCSGTDAKETTRAAERLSKLVCQALAEEREACARVAECRPEDTPYYHLGGKEIAVAIRARGQRAWAPEEILRQEG